MPEDIRVSKNNPFCPGCGHSVTINGIAEALNKIQADPLDVIIVSDIGCCGLVDNLVRCHTIHGLHGRASALATGVSLGLDNPEKIVIATQGDGGATIGLQHLLEASRQNVDMTLIVHNNMVYGMTGGQISGLSSTEFKATKMIEQRDVPSYDICELAHRAGAAYSCRTFVGADLVDKIKIALSTKGFSLVEIVEMCPAYGSKKTKELHQIADYEEMILLNDRVPLKTPHKESDSLLDSLPDVQASFSSNLKTRQQVVIAGSAGEGVQLAGELLALAGLASGLRASKKGEYPVTVATGFSLAEVILSREEILYTGIEYPDAMIITSKDGFEKAKGRIGENTLLVMDGQLEASQAKNVMAADFRKLSGSKGAALCAIATWIKKSNVLPLEALAEMAKSHKHADKLIPTIQKAEKI
jgi:pyruvate/2-oxoacid:ferredoxin oxidoreductase beta subunit/Pyruvate/2-oxoacid:ferredoxin oxidoreductase gamma subunit